MSRGAGSLKRPCHASSTGSIKGPTWTSRWPALKSCCRPRLLGRFEMGRETSPQRHGGHKEELAEAQSSPVLSSLCPPCLCGEISPGPFEYDRQTLKGPNHAAQRRR